MAKGNGYLESRLTAGPGQKKAFVNVSYEAALHSAGLQTLTCFLKIFEFLQVVGRVSASKQESEEARKRLPQVNTVIYSDGREWAIAITATGMKCLYTLGIEIGEKIRI